VHFFFISLRRGLQNPASVDPGFFHASSCFCHDLLSMLLTNITQKGVFMWTNLLLYVDSFFCVWQSRETEFFELKTNEDTIKESSNHTGSSATGLQKLPTCLLDAFYLQILDGKLKGQESPGSWFQPENKP
jgi:hypothetical protein